MLDLKILKYSIKNIHEEGDCPQCGGPSSGPVAWVIEYCEDALEGGFCSRGCSEKFRDGCLKRWAENEEMEKKNGTEK